MLLIAGNNQSLPPAKKFNVNWNSDGQILVAAYQLINLINLCYLSICPSGKGTVNPLGIMIMSKKC